MNTFIDARQYAPATDRNREPILEVLLQVLPPTGTVLEISSGTGEHATFFAPYLQPRHWQPSDPNPIAIESINAWQRYYPSENLYPAIALIVSRPILPVVPATITGIGKDTVIKLGYRSLTFKF